MTSGSLNPKWNQRPIQFEDSSHDPAASEKKTENMRIRKAKGQLISKCLFGAIVCDQKTTEIFLRISALGVKSKN